MMRILTVLVAMAGCAMAQQVFPSSQLGSPIALRWTPTRTVEPLPQWAAGPVQIEHGQAIIPLPAVWERTGIDRYVLTVVFVDTSDTGPIVEWRTKEGALHRLSNGLGEGDMPLGIHARSLLIPEEYSRAGGDLIVSALSHPEVLISAEVSPARNATVAALGMSLRPALVNKSGRAIDADDLLGTPPQPLGGDLRTGVIVDAELAADTVPFDDTLEFLVPIDGKLEGAVLLTEILGLAPEARVDVWINDHSAGELQGASFRLDDPSTISLGDSVVLAGWRGHSLYVPPHLWQEGENSIVLRIRDHTNVLGGRVSLKNTTLHLRFATKSTEPDTVLIEGLRAATPEKGIPEGITEAVSEAITAVRGDDSDVADDEEDDEAETPAVQLSDSSLPPLMPLSPLEMSSRNHLPPSL